MFFLNLILGQKDLFRKSERKINNNNKILKQNQSSRLKLEILIL